MSEKLNHLCRGAEGECTASSSRPSGDKASPPPRSTLRTNASKIFTVLFAVLALAAVGFVDRSAAHRGSAETALALLNGSPEDDAPAHSNSQQVARASKHTRVAALMASPFAPLPLTTEVPSRSPSVTKRVAAPLAKDPFPTAREVANVSHPKVLAAAEPPTRLTTDAKSQRKAPTLSRSAAATPTKASPLDTIAPRRVSAPPVPRRQEPSSETVPPARPGVTADGRVILNTATARQLTRLPGIGMKRAAKIVALRARIGRFRKLTDLLRIRGIGRKSLRKMLPRIVLDPPTG